MAEGDTWEPAVRRSLADQAAGVRPSGADLAGVAIAAGRRIHRRRTGLRLAAVVVATLLAVGTLLHVSPDGPGSRYGAVSGLVRDGVTATASPDDSASPSTDETMAAEAPAGAFDGAGGDDLVRRPRTGEPWIWAASVLGAPAAGTGGSCAPAGGAHDPVRL